MTTMVAIPYRSLIRQYILYYNSFPAHMSILQKVYWRLKENEQELLLFPSHCDCQIYGQRSCPVAPPADCLAAPINHGGKVNSKDIGIHAQQPINLLRTTRQPCCS